MIDMSLHGGPFGGGLSKGTKLSRSKISSLKEKLSSSNYLFFGVVGISKRNVYTIISNSQIEVRDLNMNLISTITFPSAYNVSKSARSVSVDVKTGDFFVTNNLDKIGKFNSSGTLLFEITVSRVSRIDVQGDFLFVFDVTVINSDWRIKKYNKETGQLLWTSDNVYTQYNNDFPMILLQSGNVLVHGAITARLLNGDTGALITSGMPSSFTMNGSSLLYSSQINPTREYVFAGQYNNHGNIAMWDLRTTNLTTGSVPVRVGSNTPDYVPRFIAFSGPDELMITMNYGLYFYRIDYTNMTLVLLKQLSTLRTNLSNNEDFNYAYILGNSKNESVQQYYEVL